ncbi:putative Outer membrane protein TolC [Nitrospira japonica]|uniref:Putative Outer membrane protein TolC n=1 Tax=Nitrospira japonica TaxID=1325564 RepID=A0A1W1I8D9_9BACT|nr:TolC family protein [Nitrospira japonica]SLM49255.1 putative Outer membrane protein TolC [Nitrospira japonica]
MSVAPLRRRFLSWIFLGLSVLIISQSVAGAQQPSPPGLSGPPGPSEPPAVIRLSLNEAIALFIKQNLSVLITRYGIDYNKGQEITASLFPNPVAFIGTLSSYTQGLNLKNSGQLAMIVQQLFELAGKRGYRIESATFGTQSAEAAFEDAVRQLGFTVKDTYYRIQLAQRRLNLAEENRDRFARILDINTIRFKKGYIAEVDLIRIRLQMVDFQSQVIQSLQDAEMARGDLRQLLRLSPKTAMELTTEMDFRRIDPDINKLRVTAIDLRPDIRAKRFAQSQRESDLRLAKAYRVPDVTVGAGYEIQGAQGPDNPQQWVLNFGIPIPLFNRNQGGILQAEVAVQSAEADLNKTVNQVENEVEVAYRNLIQSRRLVEAFVGGILDDARSTLTIVERAYERGGATILDLLDAARTSRTIQQNYIEALFTYQHNLFQLESAVGQEIRS